MRKILSLAAVLVALATLLYAQSASLTSPIAHNSETQYKIRSFYVQNPPTGTASATIDVSSQDGSNNEITRLTYAVPGCGTTTIAGLATAMITVRATETGTDTRKLQFRILGYLSDQGCLPASTLVP